MCQGAPIQGSCSEGLITMSKRLDPLLNSGGPRAFFIEFYRNSYSNASTFSISESVERGSHL